MLRILLSTIFFGLPIQISAQGFLGGVIDGLCGGCGAGEALDGLHDDLGNPLDVPVRIFNESNVEILGPILGEAIRHSRNDARAAGVLDIPEKTRFVLRHFYSENVFRSVRYRIGTSNELSVSTNSIRYGDANAVALIDTVVFATQADVDDHCLWVHEIHHVEQFQKWGVTDFGKRYVRSLGKRDGSVEAPAYAIQQQCQAEISSILASFLPGQSKQIDNRFRGSWIYLGQYRGQWVEKNFSWSGGAVLPEVGTALIAEVDVNIRADHIRYNSTTGTWQNAPVRGGIAIGQSFVPSEIIDVTNGGGYLWARVGP